MKRQIILYITLSLLLFIASFVGCGGGGSTTVTPVQPVATNTPSSPDIPTATPELPTPIATYTPNSTSIDLQQQIDAAGGGWTAGNNPVAALPDESKTLLCGCNLSDPVNKLEAYSLSGQQVPSSFSRNDYLTSIKDQGQAGTCVAFAAVACVESCVKIALNDSSKYVDLSEAHLFHYGGGNVNSGWYLSSAANYFQNPGVPPEEYFPYNPATVASGSSKSGWQNYVTKTNSWQSLGNTAAIKDYIYNYGPVLARFNVYSDFFYYKSGVYKYVSGYKVGGHAVCIYGWDDNAACWLVKNSWGYSWGGNGCFRIAYGQCGIEDGSLGLKYTTSSTTPTPAITATPTPGYVFVRKWGSQGSGDGQFASTLYLALGSSGNVYVTDTLNYRVQKFTSNGTFITKWGSQGTGDGQFMSVLGAVAVDSSNNIYVPESGNIARIQKFTSSGTFMTKFGSMGTGDGQFMSVLGFTIDPSDILYLADISNYRIQKLTSNGAFISKWGSQGSGNGQFGNPCDVALDSSGNVYVVENFNYRVQKFTSNGIFINKWGSQGTGDGQFGNYPQNITVDSSGNVYVSDQGNHRIQKFTSSGVFINKWGSYGSGDGQFSAPGDIVVDSSGNIYVNDINNYRIQVFRYNN